MENLAYEWIQINRVRAVVYKTKPSLCFNPLLSTGYDLQSDIKS